MSLNIDFVKASAGSGKTYNLMNRIAGMVFPKATEDGKIRDAVMPENILATTFTEKAAAELRSRVREKILSEPGKDESVRAEIAQRIFGGMVGTVNSLCGRLVTEHAMELGLSPDLKVLPSSKDGSVDFSRIVFERAVEGVFTKYSPEIEPLAARFDLLEYADGNKVVCPWKYDVHRIAEAARYNGIAPEDFSKSIEESVARAKEIFPGTDACRPLESVAEEIRKHGRELTAVLNIADDPGAEYVGGFVCWARAVRMFAERPSWRKAYEIKVEQKLDGETLPTKPRKKSLVTHDDTSVYELLLALRDDATVIPANFMNSIELQEDAEKLIRLEFKIAAECLTKYAEFKQRFGLIDFTDQIALALRLFREHGDKAFGAEFSERVSAIMVDEFQDTSPIELSVFMAMCKGRTGDITFVGDPKQAIYGFRGTDPSLMRSVIAKIEETNASRISGLKESWRSKEKLLSLTNAFFERAFAEDGMSKEDVELRLPAERRDDPSWKGGDIEVWSLAKEGWGDRLAEAVVTFLKKHPEQIEQLGQIAILARQNRTCDSIAAALTKRGVPVSRGAGRLSGEFECQLAMAAYRYAVNPNDEVALVSLAACLLDRDTWLSSMAIDRGAALANWRADSRIRALGVVGIRTPLEMLDSAIAAVGLDTSILRMENSDRRFRNLDTLRGLCLTYMQESSMGGYSATPLGFVDYVANADKECASAEGGNCVQVLTYHAAKGLEWPIVVLTELDSKPQASAFSLCVRNVGDLDVEDPLKGRVICVVPNPFATKVATAAAGQKKKVMQAIDGYLKESRRFEALNKSAELEGWSEMRRLMYVGMTRAQNRLVFAPVCDNGNFKTDWLSRINPCCPIEWSTSDFDYAPDGCAAARFVVTEFDKPQCELKLETVSADFFDDASPTATTQYQARLRPSADEGKDVHMVVNKIVPIGEWFSVDKIDAESAALGDAMHGYYAVAVHEDDPALAEDLLKRWKVDNLLSAEQLVKSGANLRKYINENWAGAEISTEVPMTLLNEHGQTYQGFIDMLIKVGKDYVLLDHKTGASRNYDKVAKQYAGQQIIYKQAIERATNGKVLKTILHLPVCGVCLECEL